MDSVLWARKLTLQKINQYTLDQKATQGWTPNRNIDALNNWGVKYPIDVYTFNLEEHVDIPIENMVMSYVKIGQNKRIELFLNDVNNFCWKRFFLFKELIHVFSSNSGNATIGSQHLVKVLTHLHDQNFNLSSLQDSAVKAELDAQLGAIELLLPKEIVEKMEAQYKGYENIGEDEISEIAHQYKVPKVIVKFRFLNESIRNSFQTIYSSHWYINADFFTLKK